MITLIPIRPIGLIRLIGLINHKITNMQQYEKISFIGNDVRCRVEC